MVVEFADEFIRGGLTEVLGDDHAVHVQTERAQLIDLPQNVGSVGNAEIGADFIAFQVCRADDEDDLRLIFQRTQNFALRVADKSGKHAAGVHIVKKLSSEFKVQLIVKLFDPLQNLFALQFDVKIVIETLLHAYSSLNILYSKSCLLYHIAKKNATARRKKEAEFSAEFSF